LTWAGLDTQKKNYFLDFNFFLVPLAEAVAFRLPLIDSLMYLASLISLSGSLLCLSESSSSDKSSPICLSSSIIVPSASSLGPETDFLITSPPIWNKIGWFLALYLKWKKVRLDPTKKTKIKLYILVKAVFVLVGI
jgi:hypothetical protein